MFVLPVVRRRGRRRPLSFVVVRGRGRPSSKVGWIKLYPKRSNHQIYNIELALASARVQAQLSNKHNLVLYIDRELVEKSRELGFNLSKTFENHLKQLTTQFSSINQASNADSLFWCGRRDLNPNGFKSPPL